MQLTSCIPPTSIVADRSRFAICLMQAAQKTICSGRAAHSKTNRLVVRSLTTNQSAKQCVGICCLRVEVVEAAQSWGIRAGGTPMVGLLRRVLAKAHHKAVAHPIIRPQHILHLRPGPALVPVGRCGVSSCSTAALVKNCSAVHWYEQAAIQSMRHCP